jgi:hypothetical protein
MLIKINGERNSGTNFLRYLMFHNFVDKPFTNQKILCRGDINIGQVTYFWTHGAPCNTVKKMDDKVIDIFIFRDLNTWLPSMYINCYLLKPFNTFEEFLKGKQESTENMYLDFRSHKYVNDDDNGKTIFEIRYHKYKNAIKYFYENDNVILVNMSYLQNEKNCEKFLKRINNTYNINATHFISKIEHHTKNGKKDMKNRSYDININKHINVINSSKNVEIENAINKLKFIIKVNKNKIIQERDY